jgi:hypothetical protein
MENERILTIVGEVLLSELMLLNLKSILEKRLSLGSTNGAMDCNLLVSLDGETSNGISGFAFDWGLSSQIIEYLGSFGELISRLTGTEIENQFLDLDLTHLVVELFLLLLSFHIFSKPAKLFNNKYEPI